MLRMRNRGQTKIMWPVKRELAQSAIDDAMP
jgi:hypothetical protein